MPNEKQAPEKPQTGYTNWGAFIKAGVTPKEITCQGYMPIHRADLSCHTRLPFNISTIVNHVKADHGGGFLFKLRKGDIEWPGWKQLAEAGMELQDFRCDICDEVIPLSAQRIIFHLRPHAGKTRRVHEGGEYNLTITPERPLSADDPEA